MREHPISFAVTTPIFKAVSEEAAKTSKGIGTIVEEALMAHLDQMAAQRGAAA